MMKACKCGSYAINHHCHGRDGSDDDLCDVCYWRKRAEQPAQQEPVTWRNAALRVGEDLCSVGPFGYYDMTAEQWLDWALSVVTVHAPPAQQEPVAWMHVMDNTEGIKANGTGVTSYTQKQKHPFGKPGIDFSKSYPITSTPLYTSPPAQRKPLTDDELDKCLREAKLSIAPAVSFRTGFRAAEAAHGIKGGA